MEDLFGEAVIEDHAAEFSTKFVKLVKPFSTYGRLAGATSEQRRQFVMVVRSLYTRFVTEHGATERQLVVAIDSIMRRDAALSAKNVLDSIEGQPVASGTRKIDRRKV